MPTGIEWCDETINPVRTADKGYHCVKLSEGCQNCYAEPLNFRFGNGVKYHKLFNPVKYILERKQLEKVLHWQRPRKIFIQSMSDLFLEEIPFEILAPIFGTMHSAKQHAFMILTKRPERMKGFIEWYKSEWLKGFESAWPLEYQHVWLGVTAENQARANERIPLLLDTPAAHRFISVEPMLSPVLLAPRYLDYGRYGQYGLPVIEWVICGGESGRRARPMHPYWVRDLRDQCNGSGVPFFFKQWGAWAPIDQPWNQNDDIQDLASNERWLNLAGGHGFHGDNVWRMRNVGKKKSGRLLDGQEWNQFPAAI